MSSSLLYRTTTSFNRAISFWCWYSTLYYTCSSLCTWRRYGRDSTAFRCPGTSLSLRAFGDRIRVGLPVSLAYPDQKNKIPELRSLVTIMTKKRNPFQILILMIWLCNVSFFIFLVALYLYINQSIFNK